MVVTPVGAAGAVTGGLSMPEAGQAQNGVSFARVLEEKLAEVESLQQKANALLEGFLTGQIESVHEVMLAAQKAQIALQLTVEIRNRVIESYQEIARMQP